VQHPLDVPVVTIALLLAALVPGASAAAPDRPLWLGEEFEGLRISERSDDPIGSAGVVEFFYGEAPPEGGAFPLSVQNWSSCDRHPLDIDLVPRSIERVRGMPVVAYGDRFEVLTAKTNAVVFPSDEGQGRRAIAALRAEGGSADLAPARLPRWVLAQLRLVRDEHRRLGETRALRRRLGISRGAIRFRLRLLEVLGPGALRGVKPARATPRQVNRDRSALIEQQEGVDLDRAGRRRAARQRARVRRC
jgi:hypothetical protein